MVQFGIDRRFDKWEIKNDLKCLKKLKEIKVKKLKLRCFNQCVEGGINFLKKEFGKCRKCREKEKIKN